MGGSSSQPEIPVRADKKHSGPARAPKELLQYVRDARALLEQDQAVIPCEYSGEFHDNTSGHLRGFVTSLAKRQWFDTWISKLKDVKGDVLRSWQDIDADFVIRHKSLSGVPMPPYKKLKEAVHMEMTRLAESYQFVLDTLPKEELRALQDFDELWPPRLPGEIKDRCVQPEEAYTTRMNYAAGITRLELLYVFSAGLANAVGLDPPVSVQWSIKRPLRLWSKAMAMYPREYAHNDFRRSTDVYRTSVIAESCQQIKAMLNILECLGRETFDRSQPLQKLGLGEAREHFVVERVKNRFLHSAPGGYADVLVSLRVNGYVCEIQLHLRDLYEVKGEKGRDLSKWFKHFLKDGHDYGSEQPEEMSATNSTHHQIAGGRYNGEYKNGKRHGQGSFFYNYGDRYEGQWDDGVKHGVGTYYYHTGDRYIGEWRDDRMHGRGKFMNHTGEVFEGEFREGMRHGNGEFNTLEGKVEFGSWWRNKRVDIVSV